MKKLVSLILVIVIISMTVISVYAVPEHPYVESFPLYAVYEAVGGYTVYLRRGTYLGKTIRVIDYGDGTMRISGEPQQGGWSVWHSTWQDGWEWGLSIQPPFPLGIKGTETVGRAVFSLFEAVIKAVKNILTGMIDFFKGLFVFAKNELDLALELETKVKVGELEVSFDAVFDGSIDSEIYVGSGEVWEEDLSEEPVGEPDWVSLKVYDIFVQGDESNYYFTVEDNDVVVSSKTVVKNKITTERFTVEFYIDTKNITNNYGQYKIETRREDGPGGIGLNRTGYVISSEPDTIEITNPLDGEKYYWKPDINLRKTFDEGRYCIKVNEEIVLDYINDEGQYNVDGEDINYVEGLNEIEIWEWNGEEFENCVFGITIEYDKRLLEEIDPPEEEGELSGGLLSAIWNVIKAIFGYIGSIFNLGLKAFTIQTEVSEVEGDNSLFNENIIQGIEFTRNQNVPELGVTVWQLFEMMFTIGFSFVLFRLIKSAIDTYSQENRL